MRRCKECFFFEQLDPQSSVGVCRAEPEHVQAVTVPNPTAGGFDIKQAILVREVARNRPQCRFYEPKELING